PEGPSRSSAQPRERSCAARWIAPTTRSYWSCSRGSIPLAISTAQGAKSGATGLAPHDGGRVQHPRPEVTVEDALRGHHLDVPCNLGANPVTLAFQPAVELGLGPLLIPLRIFVGRPAHPGTTTVEDATDPGVARLLCGGGVAAHCTSPFSRSGREPAQ